MRICFHASNSYVPPQSVFGFAVSKRHVQQEIRTAAFTSLPTFPSMVSPAPKPASSH